LAWFDSISPSLSKFEKWAAHFEDSAQKAEGALSLRELMPKEEAIEVEGTVVETLLGRRAPGPGPYLRQDAQVLHKDCYRRQGDS